MCSGHPTGMWESSRSPSPFCSMIVPSIGTSIVALRLTCARLHFHASGASKPREASNEAQDLLLQDYVCKLSHTQRTLEDTYALLQQTELLAGVINEQDCRAIRTAYYCPKSLRIRVEAPSQCNRTCSYEPTNTARASERATLTRQRTPTQLTQVACPGPLLSTLRIDLVPGRKNARIPTPMKLSKLP